MGPRPKRLTLQEKLVDEAETYIHQLGAELGQGLGQLEEALCLLTVGAHQGLHTVREVLQPGEILACREDRLIALLVRAQVDARGSNLCQKPSNLQNHWQVEKLPIFKHGQLFP
jgi:hypothetical protein